MNSLNDLKKDKSHISLIVVMKNSLFNVTAILGVVLCLSLLLPIIIGKSLTAP
jgi:hypothetical protein